MAFSLASAPPLVKKNVSMSPGVTSASFAPRRARGSVAMNGLAYASDAAWSWMARITFGWPCPMLVHISWLLKSRNRLPSGVQKYTPSARAIGIGSTADCADHSKMVCLPAQRDDLFAGQRCGGRDGRHGYLTDEGDDTSLAGTPSRSTSGVPRIASAYTRNATPKPTNQA